MSSAIELLTKIAENTRPDNSAIWVAAISSTSAVLGAGIGALLLYRGTSKQVESQSQAEWRKLQVSVVTTERLRWLQEIRALASEYIANMDKLVGLLVRPANSAAKIAEGQKIIDEYGLKAQVQCNQIVLMLNPEKDSQKDLRNACRDLLGFFDSSIRQRNEGRHTIDAERYLELKEKCFSSLTEIGVETWGKIKELK